MNDHLANRFVKDRHEAFSKVLHDDDLGALKKYCKKYGMELPASKKVQRGGVYKAIQECTDFSEEDKTLAMQKALALGFNPFIRPFESEEE